MPLIPIVDEEDNIIEHKERSLCGLGDIMRVSALWLTNSKGEILIAQRHKNKERNPDKWGPAVAGTVEGYETYKETIIRESIEEIGFKCDNMSISHKTKSSRSITQWYIACVDKDISTFTMQEDEVQALRWISPEDLLQEFRESPEIYIPSMKSCLELFVR